MKLIVYIILLMHLSLNIANADEKKNCSKYKRFSKEHISCKTFNLKTGIINTGGKIKNGTGNIIKKTTGIFKKKS